MSDRAIKPRRLKGQGVKTMFETTAKIMIQTADDGKVKVAEVPQEISKEVRLLVKASLEAQGGAGFVFVELKASRKDAPVVARQTKKRK